MKKILLLLAFLALPIRSGSFVSGSATCPASGNAQVSTTSYFLYQLTVQANFANAGKVYVGGSNVSTSTGAVLAAGYSYTVQGQSGSVNPATLYFACGTSSDGITWVGAQ